MGDQLTGWRVAVYPKDYPNPKPGPKDPALCKGHANVAAYAWTGESVAIVYRDVVELSERCSVCQGQAVY